MRFKVTVSLAIGVCFLLILGMMTGAVRSDDHGVQSGAGILGSGISYQGFMQDAGGNPLDGNHQFMFELFNTPSGGTALWQRSYNNVAVSEGLVDILLDVDTTPFNGQALWLAVTVDGELLSPRQELLAVPYALSVRPGAQIVGDLSDPILTVHNEDNIGILASSDNESPLIGQIDNPESQHAALAGLTDGKGPGVVGMSERGSGVHGHTNDDTAWEAAGVRGYSVHDQTFGVIGISEWGIPLEGIVENPENGNPAVVAINSGSGPGIYAYGRDDSSPDVVLGGNDQDDDGLLTSDLGHPGSDIVVASNDAIVLALDDNNDEDGNLVVVNGADQITLLADEEGNLEVMGNLTVGGAVNSGGPTCERFGPFTNKQVYQLSVPSFCMDQFCWITVQHDATIGAFSPGMSWPVLYTQNSGSGTWFGGPAVSIAGMVLSEGSGVNGDSTHSIIAASGETGSGGWMYLTDDGAGETAAGKWTFDFKPVANDLTSAIIYVCPMGRPQ